MGGSVAKSNSFKGSGSASQSNSLTGFISATVVKVYPNGNLEIKGQKRLRLTDGSEYVRLAGIVRPQDISASNTVSSNLIAEAQIEYVGSGTLSNESTPGWGSKFIKSNFTILGETMKFEKKLFLIISLLTLVFSIISQAKGDRLKDLVSFAGIRNNQLLGYGLSCWFRWNWRLSF